MHTKGTNHTMKKIHVSAINRKVRDDEKLFVEECDRKYNEKLVAIADSIEISDKAENAKRNTRRMGKMEREAAIESLYCFWQVRQGRARPQQR